MKLYSLTSIVLAILFSTVAHAQSNDAFPALPPVPQTGQLVNDPGKTQFTFIAAGDNRPSGSKVTQPSTLSYIFKHAKRYDPKFMIWAGDTIGGFRVAGQPMDREHLKKQYEEFFRLAAKAGVPVFNSPGNHEMDRVDKSEDNGQKESVETPDEKMQKLYLEMYGYPANASSAYGAFNYGNSRFIAVDTEEIPTTLAVKSPGQEVANNGTKLKLDPGFVTPKQIELLTADLDANKDKAHIFVFMHHPIKPAKSGSRLNAENADALEKLFAQYANVTYVIAAHEHIYYNHGGKSLNPKPRTSSDGPKYLVTGGAGAPLDSCPSHVKKNCLAANHYVVFSVDGDKVDVKMIVVPVKLTKTKQSN
jgi:hypothetical protein